MDRITQKQSKMQPNKHILLSLFVLLTLLLPGFSAKSAEDDVKERLAEMTDTQKVTFLSELVKENQRVEPAKAVEYGTLALDLLKVVPNDVAHAEILERIAWAHIYLRDIDQAMAWGQKGVDFAREKSIFPVLASSLNCVGAVHLFKAEYHTALKHFDEALKISEDLKDKRIKAKILFSLGNVYYRLSQYTRSVEYFLQSLKIVEHEKNADKYDIASINNSLGNVYLELRDFSQALEFFHKALAIMTQLDDKHRIWSVLNNLGTVYEKTGDYQDSLRYYLKALAVLRDLGNQQRVPFVMNNIGHIYSLMGKQEKALEYCRQSVERSRVIGDKLTLTDAWITIGTIYKKQRRMNKSLESLEKAVAIAGEIDAPASLADAYEELSYVYTGMKDFRNAQKYSELSNNKRDKIFNDNIKNKIAEMQTRYETEKKEKKIEILKKDNAINQLEMDRQVDWERVLFGSIAVLVGFALLLFNRYRLKVRSNKEIRNKNEELTRAYEELEKAHNDLVELGGLIPICSKCKRIRDDSGYWHQVEVYIKDHSDAEFTHGICPKCMETCFPDMTVKDDGAD